MSDDYADSPGDRAGRALALRQAGVPLRKIQESLGYGSADEVRDDLRAARDGTADQEDERELHADRLDRLILGLWKSASSGENLEATKLVRDLLDSRARVLGLARVSKHER